ncbi:MAG: bifunctional oligoribonuclease/PAP phosphatase NrnA [Rectinemataceae bacterium]
MKKVPQGILSFIESHDCFYVLGHKEPDGDCVGSQLALSSFLKTSGKRVHVLSSGPFTRTEILEYEHRFRNEAPPERDFERTAALVLDCSTMGRIGDVSASMPPVPIAFIDHHASSAPSGDVDYIDSSAPSVTTQILLLMEAMGHAPTREEAELLFFGLCTDTGFFRHLDESGGDAMRIAARLVDAGVSPKRTFYLINGGKSLFSRKLMGEILVRTEPHYDGRLLVSSISLEDQRRYGMASRDSDMLYQLLMGVSGCEAAMIVRQESESQCTVGFRSRERVDVASIAAAFGGGGHRLAAGLSINGGIEEVTDKLIQAFGPAFSEDLPE